MLTERVIRSSLRTTSLITVLSLCFFFQAEDGIRGLTVTGVQTCALPIYPPGRRRGAGPRRRRSRSRDVAAQQSRDLVPYLRAGGARPGLRSLPLPRGRGESPHQPGARSLREDGGAEVLRGADRAGGEPRGGAGGLSV